MLVTHEREKLINAIIYFSSNTRNCGVTKLFKLLYFLDFEHFKKTGRSVTGLEYSAWKMGPVPVSLYDEIPASPEPDLAEKVRIKPVPLNSGKQFVKLEPISKFDGKHFSRREIALLQTLANEYRDAYADDMVEATHLENLPWHQVYVVEGRKQQPIPYEYAVRKDEEDFIAFVKKENDEVTANYAPA